MFWRSLALPLERCRFILAASRSDFISEMSSVAFVVICSNSLFTSYNRKIRLKTVSTLIKEMKMPFPYKKFKNRRHRFVNITYVNPINIFLILGTFSFDAKIIKKKSNLFIFFYLLINLHEFRDHFCINFIYSCGILT